MEDFRKIEQQWDTCFALVDDGEVFALQRDAVSSWSVGKQVGHIALAMESIADEIQKMLETPSQGAGLEPKDFAFGVLNGGIIPRGVGKAPAGIVVQGEAIQGDIRSILERAKKKWDTLAEKQDEIEKSSATYPHFAFGPFTSGKWVRFMAVHTAHHLKIVRDIMKDAGRDPSAFDLLPR